MPQAAQDIAAETGLEHRSVADDQRVTDIYRKIAMLASGRYAMLDNGGASRDINTRKGYPMHASS